MAGADWPGWLIWLFLQVWLVWLFLAGTELKECSDACEFFLSRIVTILVSVVILINVEE